MIAKINKTLLRTIRPSNKAYDVRDNELRGFILRVQPSGRMSYACQYGRGKRITIGSTDLFTPAQARDIAMTDLAQARLGIDPSEKRRRVKADSLKEFLDEVYLPWAQSHISDYQKLMYRLNNTFAFLHKKALTDITIWQLEVWRTKRKKLGRKPATINRDIAELRAVLSKAVEWTYIRENPLIKIKSLKCDNMSRVRYLTTQEEIELRKALQVRDIEKKAARKNHNLWRGERGYTPHQDLSSCAYGDHLTPMVILSLNTGLRRGELFNLKWEDINFDTKVLTVNGIGSKSKKTRHIALNEEAMTILSNWQAQTRQTDLIFASPYGGRFDNIDKAWRELLNVAKVTNFRWHDLRHTFASKLAMADVALNTIRELLGHSNFAMTQRYTHLAPDFQAEAVAKISHIGQAA